jgi:thiol:disulfide interchange protein DsbD
MYPKFESSLWRTLLFVLALLPALAWSSPDNPAQAGSPQFQAGFLDNLFGKQDELLPPELAFDVNVAIRNPHMLVVRFKPAKGYYLYRQRLSFSLPEFPGATIEEVSMPKGKLKEDAFFGTSEVYYEPFDAELRISGYQGDLRSATLKVGYQGCSESGVCYPPTEKTIVLSSAPVASDPGDSLGNEDLSESGRIGELLAGGNYWLIVASFLGFGLLLAFTPCMLPMIPILSGIIVRQNANMGRARSIALSVSYVLGMAITYAAAGVAAGLSGVMISAFMQNPWVLGSFSAFFVILALSMFGWYELQMPASLQNRIGEASNRLRDGNIASVFGMGVLSAVIVGPCVAAPLAGAMLYISQTQDVVLGGAALFALAIGMGMPLILIGASAGTLLPKAGPWMNKVKTFFGALLLATAIWTASAVMPSAVTMLLWAAWLVACFALLWPWRSGGNGRSMTLLQQGVSILFLALGIGLAASVATGGRDMLAPFAHLNKQEDAATLPDLRFRYIDSIADLNHELENARGQYVMLDFYADWCVSCKEMDAFVFTDERVKGKLQDTVLIKADVTAATAEHLALLKRFGLFGPPGTLFFDREGNLMKGREVIGYMKADKFLAHLNKVMR